MTATEKMKRRALIRKASCRSPMTSRGLPSLMVEPANIDDLAMQLSAMPKEQFNQLTL